MTTTLQMHSYDVYDNDGNCIGRHTGYNLVTINDDGTKTIERVDLYKDSLSGEAKFNISSSAAEEVTFVNKDTQETQQAYWNAGVTPEQIQHNNFYNSGILASGDDAKEAYNKIKLDAALSNFIGLDYDIDLPKLADSRTCNTATNYWGEQYIPNFDGNIYNSLPDGTTFGYYGSNDDYVNATDYNQAQKIKFINNLIGMLDEAGALEDILSDTPPFISDKYLSILGPYLSRDILSEGDTIPLTDLIVGIFQGIINPFSINYFNQIDLIKNSIKNAFATAEVQTSPLILDLDGDGVETIGTNSGVYFDHANDGFKENTGWVGKDDGLLVRDINGNGQIDNGTELFGNNSVLSNGKKAKNGFEALKDLDSNQDYVFDQNDAAWNEVKVWKDSNSNGIVDEGELLTMEQAGVDHIRLTDKTKNQTDEFGNIHRQSGYFMSSDGKLETMTDVWFATESTDTIDQSPIEIPDELKDYPEIMGFGNMRSLRQVIATDESGELKALVDQYITETDVNARGLLIDDIIFHWAGVQDIDPESRKPSHFYDNPIGDARKLEALEEFMGREYSNKWWFGQEDHNPFEQASQYLLSGYDRLAEYVRNSLDMQTHYKDLLQQITLVYDQENGKWEANVDDVYQYLKNLSADNPEAAKVILSQVESIIKNQNISSEAIYSAFRMLGESDDSVLKAQFLNFGKIDNLVSDGNDIVDGTENNDTILSLAGDDKVYGNGGDDFLDGGEGNDYLVGGKGSDTYFFSGAWGHDKIDNSSTDTQENNPDTILFGADVMPTDILIQRLGNDLILMKSDGTASVTVYSYFLDFGQTSNTVKDIKFNDDTIWDYEYILAHYNSVPDAHGGLTKEGGNNNDYLTGSDANDFLIGNGGDDSLYGNSGNDIFIGGKGNDTLNGGNGDDTYIYNLGDGLDTIMDNNNRDTISFGEGISWEDLSFSLVKHNYLKITVKGDENQGIIIQSFNSGQRYKIEDLSFSDGTIVHLADIPLTYHQNDEDEILYLSDNGDTIYAEGGKDQITGGTGNDTIAGGKGWDVIQGSGGQNTYIWNLGDGFDTITCNYGSDDSIKFGAGIKFEDLTFRYDYPNLVILVNGDETQGMTISRPQYLHYLKFANGRTVDLTKTGLTYHQTDDEEYPINGSDNNDVIYGFGGNDTISAAGGDDTIIGGKGCDTLNGGDGDDTYVWNLGDGLDTVSDSSGTTTLQFGEGITLDNLTFEKSNYQWRVYVNGDRTQGFYCSQGMPDIIKLADGSVLKMNETGWNIHNSDNNDNIQGSVYDDVINGGGGDDSITSEDGNDTLIGGKGDDSLVGGDGDDTYVWNLGDGFDSISDNSGTDRIKFGAGITFDDLSFAKNPNGGLEIYVKGDRCQGLYVSSHFIGGTTNQIEWLEFADGSTFDLMNSEIEFVDYQKVVIDNRRQPVEITEMNGSDGADQMTNRYDYSVTFNGGKGNDSYNGGGGADTYIYNLGDGLDYIYDNSGDNRIKFGPGISYEDLSFRTNYGGILFIFVDPEMTQGLKLSSRSSIKYLEFADGSVVDFSTQNFVVRQDNKDESLEINDNRITHLYMGDGDSTVYNRVGHDITIIGGKGNDTIRGGSGVDTYVWNLGDGMDNLRDTEAKDKIVFGAGITAADLTFRKERNGLRIIVKNDENQGMLIANYQLYNQNELKNIYFADGSSLDISQSIVLHQTNADDEFCVGYGDNTVYCGAGNDKIESYGGDNIYVGGTGNDSFSDWDGDDTYIYNLGDGFDSISDGGGDDKIVFGKGINPGDLSFKRNENNLSISINGNEEQGIEISNHFGSDSNKIETIEFHDGSTLDISNADQLIQAMNSFSISNSASTDTPSNPTQDVTDMYSLAANSDLTRKAA